MSSATQPSLALLSINVNGLGQKAKRLTLFSSLIDGPWDIIVLQETHHTDEEQGIRWTREGAGHGRPWPGTCYWAAGTSASRGVAILFRDRVSLEDTAQHSLTATQHQGRILRVDFSWQQQPLTIVAVYAPSTATDRQGFFRDLLLPVIPHHGHVLMGGDLNCVGTDLDVTPNAAGRRRTGYVQGLQLVEDTFGLTDAWREQHPGVRQITHTCAADSSGARLDRWLVSTDILHHVRHTDIIMGLPGDHLGVVITIHSPTGQSRGPAPWSFPMQLLDDPAYVAELTDLVQQTLQQHPVCQTYSHGQRWDALKRDIRDHCTEYSRLDRLRQTAETAVLRRRAAETRRAFTEAPTTESHLSLWQQAHRDLQQHLHDRAQAAAVRAGVLWQDYGEQSTFYFYHLGRQRQLATTFTQVRASSGETFSLSDPQGRVAAGQALAEHFSSASPHGLFTPQPTCSAAQQEMLGAVDTCLSEEAAQACEGTEPITLDELKESLAALSRGKQPGSDGLPYEFYQQLWNLLGNILLDVFLEAFHSGDSGSLTSSQVQGTITLLYKGKGSRADPGSYRPITLLNTDVKLLAKTLTDRWAAHIGTVVDSTQTAFLPGRWIGDNVLAHLEEMEYLETAKEPGCVAFLDFSKAYDRLDRQWVLMCMQKLGFGTSALRWVGLLHTHLTARVRFNAWHSPTFPVDTGLAQGSPLSPLLFVIAAQPLAAHLRLQTLSGVLQPISRPDGSAAPPCHQHADDTTLHLKSRQDLQTALETSIQPFCLASGSSLNAGKSQAMMLGGDDFHGLDPGSGISFIQRGQSLRHLGIRLSTEPQTAALETYTAILGAVRQVACHWVSRQLTLIGRVHVAKQVLASKVTYHATFIPIPSTVAKELTTCLVKFVSGAGPSLRPARQVFALPWEQGGMRLIQLPDIEAALQAKVVSRLFEPERLVWKDFAALHLSRSRQWLLNHPHVHPRTVDLLGYGVRMILGTRRTQDLGVQSLRFRAYIRAYRRLSPHRLVQPASLSRIQLDVEPLFYNLQVTEEGRPLTPTGDLLLAAQMGVTDVGHLHLPPPGVDSTLVSRLLDALPDSWRGKLQTEQSSTDWFQQQGPPGVIIERLQSQTVQAQPFYRAYAVADDGRMTVLPQCPQVSPADMSPRVVVMWDPSRPWRPGRRRAAGGLSPYLLGSPSASCMDPHLWGIGSRPLQDLVVREATTRLTVMAAVQKGTLLPASASCLPAAWDTDDRGLSVIQARWLDKISARQSLVQTASPPGSCRSASDAFGPDYASGAPWMNLYPGYRTHWRDRQAEQEDQPAPAFTPELPPDDTVDPAAPLQATQEPWSAVWSRLHQHGLDRSHRLLAWQILHVVVPCGASLAFWTLSQGEQCTDEEIMCPHCQPQHIPETITHMFLECPIAAALWQWVAQLWAAFSGGQAPPATAQVLLADDQSQWQPSTGLQLVWTQIRIATLTALRDGAIRRRRGLPASAVSAAASLLQMIRAAISRDWRRVQFTGPEQLTAGICCSSWLRGRHPFITAQQFGSTWALRGVLCSVNQSNTLLVHLNLTSPVHFTGSGEGGGPMAGLV